jgi:2-phosphoglycerate kinase
MNKPSYKFTNPNTLLFLTGVALAGKSTIAPLISSSIEGCALQSMDILRILAKTIENYKPKEIRTAFLSRGSLDSYELLGDGSYSPESLIKSFNLYSQAVSSLLHIIIPELESRGERNMLFEGVQLTPSIVKPYLMKNNIQIILHASKERLQKNKTTFCSKDQNVKESWYPIDRLLLLQEEIVTQSKKLPQNSVHIVENVGSETDTAQAIINYLLENNIIKKI